MSATNSCLFLTKKLPETAFSTFFLGFFFAIIFRPEVVSGVSGVVVEQFGVDVIVILGQTILEIFEPLTL